MTDNNKLRVLIADDHTLFRKGMQMLIETLPMVDWVHDVENGQKVVDYLKTNTVDLVFLDIDMPIMDGKETASRIIKKYPNIKIIMVSMFDSLSLVSELINIGIHSYLLKDSDPSEVAKAVKYVTNNEFYYNRIVSNALKLSQRTEELEEKHGITKREIQIIKLICEEMTMKEIGELLGVSEQTVHTHRKNLMKKINAKNAVGLVKYAFQQKIVQL